MKRSIPEKASQSSFYAWIICSIGAAFYCYEYILRITPSIMSHPLMRAFHLDAAAFGNLAACYYYAYMPMQIPVGLLMDRFGPRRLLLLAIACCLVGSWLFTFHHVLLIAQFGRFLVGFGSAFAFVGVLKLATIWLPASWFGFVSGATSSLGMLGAIFGDDLLASAVTRLGWERTVLWTGVIGLFVGILIAAFVFDGEEPNRHKPQTVFDFKREGMGLIASLKNPYLWFNGLAGCLLFVTITAFAELWGIPYLESVYHLSTQAAAEANTMIFLGFLLGAPVIGWLSDTVKRRRVFLLIGGVGTAAVFVCLQFASANLSLGAVYGLLLACGMFASVEVLVFPIGRDLGPFDCPGISLAMTNMLTMVGGALFQPLMGWVIEHHHALHGATSQAADYQIALWLLPAAQLLAIVFISLTPRTCARAYPDFQ